MRDFALECSDHVHTVMPKTKTSDLLCKPEQDLSRMWARAAHLHHRMTPRRCLDGSPAPLRFIVGPVVGLGMHLDLQLILAKLAG